MLLDWQKFPNTFDEFLEVVLSCYPCPTPWVDASEDNLRSVLPRIGHFYQRLASDCRKEIVTWFCDDLADLVTDVLRVEIRAQPGHHFDAASKLASRAGLGWIDREQAEKQFDSALRVDSDCTALSTSWYLATLLRGWLFLLAPAPGIVTQLTAGGISALVVVGLPATSEEALTHLIVPQRTKPSHELSLGELSVRTFIKDLPELLKQYPGMWVAYHGNRRVGIAKTDLELYNECTRQEIPDDEYIVSPIELEPPDEVDSPYPLD
jgi:hypothetical protein